MPEKEWFKSWFDTEYYHQLYSNRDFNEAEQFIIKLIDYLQLPKGSKLLDVACGKGRHSLFLSKLGMDVTGIDLSPNSIAEAKQNEHEHLHFAEWDMRKVYQENAFYAVVNLFSSFGYFDKEEDDLNALKAMVANLKPEGVFVFDFLNTACATKLLKSREIIPRGDLQFHIQKTIKNGFIIKEIDLLDKGENYHYEERLKCFSEEDLKRLFTQANLTITHQFGDYDLNPFDVKSSPRIILLAKKQSV